MRPSGTSRSTKEFVLRRSVDFVATNRLFCLWKFCLAQLAFGNSVLLSLPSITGSPTQATGPPWSGAGVGVGMLRGAGIPLLENKEVIGLLVSWCSVSWFLVPRSLDLLVSCLFVSSCLAHWFLVVFVYLLIGFLAFGLLVSLFLGLLVSWFLGFIGFLVSWLLVSWFQTKPFNDLFEYICTILQYKSISCFVIDIYLISKLS